MLYRHRPNGERPDTLGLDGNRHHWRNLTKTPSVCCSPVTEDPADHIDYTTRLMHRCNEYPEGLAMNKSLFLP